MFCSLGFFIPDLENKLMRVSTGSEKCIQQKQTDGGLFFTSRRPKSERCTEPRSTD
ncbi:hypothetical protein HMPREF0372_02670 [Flavonifractor plautii ATCC 29863]|uniref:Uncharacterized protein n=1 Tax=Flavonifractor plautii ATCC 29863 TaxID=411475 RepID=G9YT11_FLAPL|nr:hypothetical protein HMPREF0372_02670 [Flavonifractor plautii ATCC 29863]